MSSGEQLPLNTTSPAPENEQNEFTEIIANINVYSPSIPVIPVQLNGEETPFLIDTGSSISLIAKKSFDQLKSNLTYKMLSRRVKIATISQQVEFNGCAEISFKVGKHRFRHPLYLFNLKSTANFTGILGFDFLRKFNVVIFPEIEACKIKHDFIYFSNRSSNSNSYISQQFNQVVNQMQATPVHDNSPQSNINFKDLLDAPPFIPNSAIQQNSINEDSNPIVKIKEDCIIQPHDITYLNVKAKVRDSFKNCDILFSPQKALENTVQQCVISIKSEIDENDTTNLSPTIDNFDEHSFYISCENNTDETIMLNHDSVIGQLHHIEDQKPAFQNNSHNLTNSQLPINEEQVNLIQASDQVVNKRKHEFSQANIDLKHLNKIEAKRIYKVLKANFKAFSSSIHTMGHTDRIKPHINFLNDYPIKALPFPVPQALQDEARRQLDEMVSAGIIERNVATWACPMLLVKKKGDGSGAQQYRMALDLRLLNSVIEHSSYPLPKIQTLINCIAKYKFFTLLDMPSAYHQVHLPEEYQNIVSFTTQWGTYRCRRLPFGLKTAASIFQAMIDLLIEEMNIDGIFSYQDDTIICSNTFEETTFKLNQFLEVFSKHNLTLNLNKCTFHKTSVNFLGFHIQDCKIFPIENNISKINSFPAPKTKRQLKAFLGLCGFYRHLIPSFAAVSEPLVALTSPKRAFSWSQNEEDAFQNLQRVFFQKPFLKQPNFNDIFYVNTDASKFAIGAVVLQRHGEDLLPIAYFSKALRKAETKYPPIQLELMAIAKALTAFRNLLYGRHFILLSDSKPLRHYRKTSSPADIITRWLMDISEYSFTFSHIPGKLNILADFLSRTPLKNNSSDLTSEPNLISSEEILPIIEQTCHNNQDSDINSVNPNISDSNSSELPHHVENQVVNSLTIPPKDALLDISIPTLFFEQRQDPELKKIILEIQNNAIPKVKNFTLCDRTELLISCAPSKNDQEPVFKIVVPQNLKEKCIRIHHLSHLGIDKTYKNILKTYWWKGIFCDVANYVKSCTRCATVKHQRIPTAPFQNSIIPTRPGQLLSLDFVGPFQNGQHILTMIDHFSKHLKLYPLKKITAMNTVHSVFDYVINFGRPEIILADHGTQFTAQIFDEFNRMLGIHLRHTTVAHPQANAVSERINLSIKATIKALMLDGHSFDTAAKIHQSIYNSTFHNTIKTTPNKVQFGRNLACFVDTVQQDQYQHRLDVHHDYYNLMNNLQKLYEDIHNNLITFQRNQNSKQHLQAKIRKPQIGDIVYLTNNSKFKQAQHGPMKIIEQCNEVIFKVQYADEPNSKIQKVHLNRMIIPKVRKTYLRPEAIQHHSNISSQPTDNVEPATNPVVDTDDANQTENAQDNEPAPVAATPSDDTVEENTHTPRNTSQDRTLSQGSIHGTNQDLDSRSHGIFTPRIFHNRRYNLRDTVRKTKVQYKYH